MQVNEIYVEHTERDFHSILGKMSMQTSLHESDIIEHEERQISRPETTHNATRSFLEYTSYQNLTAMKGTKCYKNNCGKSFMHEHGTTARQITLPKYINTYETYTI